jgi:hypothetical protein
MELSKNDISLVNFNQIHMEEGLFKSDHLGNTDFNRSQPYSILCQHCVQSKVM